MPKVTISDFSGGLALRDRNIPNNQFYVGDGLDIHSVPGYIRPSIAITSAQDTSGSILRGIPVNCVVDVINGTVYVITSNGDLHQITNIDNAVNTAGWNSNFDGSAHYYYAIPSYSTGQPLANSDLIIYNVSGTPKLFFSYNTSNHSYIGTYDLSSTFSATAFDLGALPSNLQTTNQSPLPMIEWNAKLWTGNYRYIHKYDGSTNTLSTQALDLGQGWVITSLFSTQNYIGICASRNITGNSNLSLMTESRVFYWDGTSSTYNLSVPVQDNKISSSVNHNGNMYLTTLGRNTYGDSNTQGLLGTLTATGMSVVKRLSNVINGTLQNWVVAYFPSISIINNRLHMGGSTGAGAIIGSYGNTQDNEASAFSFPYLVSSTTTNYVIFAKQVKQRIFIGWKSAASGGGGTLSQVDLTSTTYGTATYKSGYFDFGQKVRINYVKFYYKSLVASDSVTPTLDVDYGGSITLVDKRGNTTISYTNDSRSTTDPNNSNTSKRFDVRRDCHAFRPCLAWTVGGTPFSKIVIDYDFQKEDN